MPRSSPIRPANEPSQPWRSFLQALDGQLDIACNLHCLGGFVVTQLYGIGRETSDIDFLAVVPRSSYEKIESTGGINSALHGKYGVYVQRVTIATYPENYAARLVRMFPAAPWQHLRLFALEAHDLALSKLERNNSRDREDVRGLAKGGHLDAKVLNERYQGELRPNFIANEKRHDLTLELWLEMCWPELARN